LAIPRFLDNLPKVSSFFMKDIAQNTKEIIQKLRKFEIRIRKVINTQMNGDFHSVFKGTGLEFNDVREYQYGDDVRTIDWNVSAKGDGTYVKTFKEEKEQTVFFLLDVSASQEIGRPQHQKIDISREVCGVLALSAVKEGSQVGLICFSDKKEKYVKPGKGLHYAYSIISNIFSLKPQSFKTDINSATYLALNLIRRKSVIVIISDFIDQNYENGLRALAKRHDLVVIHIADARETNFPKLGIIPLYDKERRKTVWINTSSEQFAGGLSEQFNQNKTQLESFCKKNQINYLALDTATDYVPALIRLFRVRNRRSKS
jgi:uncharacterized protein (DUF58 family)